MKNKEWIKIVEEIAPLKGSVDWDNSGVQIQINEGEVKRVLVALEINSQVIAEGMEKKVDWIITHHPLIFSGMTTLKKGDATSDYVTSLIKGNINVYSAHLTFDNAKGGNNDYLGKLLGLECVQRPERIEETIPFVTGKVQGGESLDSFIKRVKKALHLSPKEIFVVEGKEENIEKVGITTGAGSEFLDLAREEGCQLFLTGELKYHQSQKAKELGVHMIGAGHYGTEKIFIENFASKLRNKVGTEVTILESTVNGNPYMI